MRLESTRIREADLFHANLLGADLFGADLRGSLIESQQLAQLDSSQYKVGGTLKSPNRELNRLLMAAVVNRRFRKMLLTNPAKAIESGYRDEAFDLTPAHSRLLLSIKAATIEEFAQELAELLAKPDAESEAVS